MIFDQDFSPKLPERLETVKRDYKNKENDPNMIP